MRFGLDVGIYGRLASPEQVLALAELADTAGFDSVWLADHVVFPKHVASRYPYSPTGAFPVPADDPILEPIATMGVLAGATRNVRIGTAVLVIPYRNPVLLGKMLATIDAFSGGRVILGAGVGWLEEEFEALASPPFADRGQVTDEYLEVVKRVCAGGEVSYAGAHYRLDTVFCQPASVQRPHPPVLIGGTSRAALRRTARLGDGWLSVALHPEQLPERLAALDGCCREHGRTLGELDLYHKVFINIGEAKRAYDGGRETGTGTAAQIVDDFKRVADLGFGHAIVRYLGADASAQAAQLRTFVDEIAPRI